MKIRQAIMGWLMLFVITAAMTPFVMAQSLVSGDLVGTVTDPSGAVLPGATVKLTNVETGESHTATTNSGGGYRFTLLRPGSYKISVEASGFVKTEANAEVALGQTLNRDVKMSIGGQSTSVEVTTEGSLINTDNADLSTAISLNVIQNQPNGGNDITYVAQTAPGITMNTGGGYGNFSSNGLPATSNLFTINGENDMDPYLNLNNSGATNLTLGRNELQEASVTSNAYSGQNGQQAGAQVTYVTKSGTNQFHGNAEYWWTGRVMDANDWISKHVDTSTGATETPRPFANNNEWAASIGGPIQKDKTFFFADYEGIRYIVPSTQVVFAPSQAFINDTLTNLATASPASIPLYTKMFNLYQSAPGYAGGIHGTSGNCVDYTGAASLLLGGAGDCLVQYNASPALPGTEFILSGRVDHNFSESDRVFWRARMDHGTQATSADPLNHNFSAASFQPAYDGQTQWNHIFSPNVTNQFIGAVSYYRALFDQINAASTFPYAIPTGYQLSGMDASGFAFPQGRDVTQYQIIDDLSASRGNHAFKFGVNFRRYDISDYVFSERNVIPEVVSLSLASLATGSADEYIQAFPENGKNSEPVALWGMGIYGQDEWKIAKNLKLTLALRAEHDSNPVCQTNCAALPFQPLQSLSGSTDVNTPYNQLVQGGRHQIFRSADALNWSPRVGFAWSPNGQNTVIKGGAGIFFDALPAVIGDQFMLNFPADARFTLLGGALTGTPLYWADPTATGAQAIATTSNAALVSGYAAGENFTQISAAVPAFSRPTIHDATAFHTPQFQEWSFGVEQALGTKTSVSAMYVGNHGIHVPIYNEGLNAHAAGITGVPAARTYPMFGAVEQYNTDSVSNYNGLVTSFKRHMTYGFEIMANYTWSHAFDEVSNGGVEPSNGTSSLVYQMNPFNLRQNYGPADYDIRHNFTATYVWTTPWKFSNHFVQGAIGGWVMSQNFFVHSGLPFTVIDESAPISNLTGYAPAAIVAGNGQGNCTPSVSSTSYSCLNASAFEFVSNYGAFPTTHRNGFRGPGFFDSDFSINKNFKLTEKFAFGFGANFYNIFNHPNFANPDSNLADVGATFGQMLSTVAPPTGPYGSFFTGLPSGRIIQFQGKIVF